MTGAIRDMAFSQEETFGPLAPLLKFDTDYGVIEMANYLPASGLLQRP